MWKQIEGYLNYQISSDGQVKNIKRNRLLNPWKGTVGYLVVGLSNGREKKIMRVHRLIGLAFLDNPDNLPCVCHQNDKKLDNTLDNLYWGSVADNARDRKKNGNQTQGVTHHLAVLDESAVVKIRKLYTGQRGDIKNIAEQFSVTQNCIADVVYNRTWKHV